MIAKVIPRAAAAAGQAAAATIDSGRRLMAYLLGPGDEKKAGGPAGEVDETVSSARAWDAQLGRRGNSHTRPRVVAAWDECRELNWANACQGVDWSRPAQAWDALAVLARDIAGSTTRGVDHVRGQLGKNAIWHTIMAAHPEDGELSDDQWDQVAKRLMHETGLAKFGDNNPVRWVAVRHGLNAAGADHIHVMAVLVRRDGSKPSTHNDVLAAHRSARWAEQQFGLVPGKGRAEPAEPAMATRADKPSTRGEMSQAAKAGPPYERPEGVSEETWARICSEGRDRMWTRQGRARIAVLSAAARAVSTDHLIALLAEQGYQVRLRYSKTNPGEVTGWSITAPPDNRGGKPKSYRGSALGSDCTWPAIREHVGRLAQARGSGIVGETEGQALISRERMVAAGWGEEMIRRVIETDLGLGDGTQDTAAAYWLRDAFWQLAWRLEGSQGKHGLFTDAAYAYSCVAAGGVPSVPPELTAAMVQVRENYAQVRSRVDELVAQREVISAESERWDEYTSRLDAQADALESRAQPHLPLYLGGPHNHAMVGSSIVLVGLARGDIRAHAEALKRASAAHRQSAQRSDQMLADMAAGTEEIRELRKWVREAKKCEAQMLKAISTYERAQQQWRDAVGRLLVDARRSAEPGAEERVAGIDRRIAGGLAATASRR